MRSMILNDRRCRQYIEYRPNGTLTSFFFGLGSPTKKCVRRWACDVGARSPFWYVSWSPMQFQQKHPGSVSQHMYCHDVYTVFHDQREKKTVALVTFSERGRSGHGVTPFGCAFLLARFEFAAPCTPGARRHRLFIVCLDDLRGRDMNPICEARVCHRTAVIHRGR